MEMLSIELLGFAAGAVNLFSSVPQLLANLRNPDLARGQSVLRNAFQCAGNALWLIYGLKVGSIAMATFALLGCLMACILLMQTLKSKTQRHKRPEAPPALNVLAGGYAH